MSEARFVFAQFCDDVRNEIGNKFTLVGCYGDDLLFPTFPAALSKLCVVVRCVTPLENPFRSISITAQAGDKTLAQLTVPPEVVSATASRRQGSRFQVINAVLVMTPFTCDDECDVAIIATIDGVEYRPQALLVRAGEV